MPYLNLDLDYFDHPKTKRLVGLLGRGSELLPLKMWSYCGKFHSEDGELSGYSAQEIESLVGWWGRAGEAVSALVKVGFLSQSEDGYAIHEWSEHEGHIAAFKQRAKHAAVKRWDKIRPCSKHATSIAKDDPKQCPIPNLTKPSPYKPPKGGNGGEGQVEPPGFARWWGEYPPSTRKADRRQCLKVWRDRKLEPIAGRVIECLRRFKGSDDWTRDGGRYIKAPLPWLRKAPWETDPADLIAEEPVPGNGFKRAPATTDIIALAFGEEGDAA